MIKKIEIKKPENNHSFVEGWMMENTNLCDNIIEFFETNPSLQKKGISYSGLNPDIKDSIDLPVNPIDLENNNFNSVRKYMDHLNECYWEYLDLYKLNKHFEDLHIGPFNIQKYNQGGHFKLWHSERMNMSVSSRLFAWMTYLNDVEDGGETEFFYYGLKIKPIKGLTLIWPCEWTHLHKGSITNEIKYVITGWLHFPDNLRGV